METQIFQVKGGRVWHAAMRARPIQLGAPAWSHGACEPGSGTIKRIAWGESNCKKCLRRLEAVKRHAIKMGKEK